MLRRLKIFIAIAAVALLAIGSLAYWILKRGMVEEDSLHLTIFTCEIIDRHFDKTGRWPKSWEEMRDDGPMTYPGPIAWPDEMELLKRRVRVDFGLTNAYLTEVKPDAFHGIEPIEDSFPSYEGGVRRLLDRCREKIKRDRAAARSPVPPSP